MLSQTPRSQTPASSFVLCIEFYLEKKKISLLDIKY